MDKPQASISVEDAARAVDSMSRRVALLYISFARALVSELGEQAGTELIRKAVWDYGTRIGVETRARVEAQGLEPTPENFGAGSDLPALGFASQPATVDGEERSRMRGCVLAQVWKETADEKLGGLYCLVDPAKMQAYCPGMTMVHTRKELWGDDCCEFAVRSLDQPD